VGERFKPAGC